MVPQAVQASLPAGIDSRCMTGRVICVDKTQRVLRWMVDGQIRLTMDARFGSPDYPTEEGSFSVYKKVYDDWSIQFDAPMQMSLYYYGGEAVHYSETFARDGYNGASHGCVNTRSWGGQTQLFNEAQIGDRVVIYWS